MKPRFPGTCAAGGLARRGSPVNLYCNGSGNHPKRLVELKGKRRFSVRVIIEEDAQRVAERAAAMIAELVRSRPRTVLGLATGGTPTGCYRELVRLHREGELDFSSVTTFNLDEYVGLSAQHPQSYHRFMQQHLFAEVNVAANATHLPDGMAIDLARECDDYERAIADAGGIDLQLLGIGRAGHIGFNEPGSSLASRTRVKHLMPETIADNARFFGSADQVPRLALTMGVGTILDARHCLLIATGANKAAVIRATLEGPITAAVPATALQLHKKVTVILDPAAAAELQYQDYYRMSELAQRELIGLGESS